MLDRRRRLTSSAGFSTATRRGSRAGTRTVVVHVHAPAPAVDVEDSARVGFVVGKAVGNAVTRNRVRRRLRHLVRERLDVLPPGVLVVVRALPPAAEASYQALAEDLDRGLGRVLREPAGTSRPRRTLQVRP